MSEDRGDDIRNEALEILIKLLANVSNDAIMAVDVAKAISQLLATRK